MLTSFSDLSDPAINKPKKNWETQDSTKNTKKESTMICTKIT